MINKAKQTACTHTFPPFINRDSEILILGSFPSVASREAHFYYMHPQNRFWPVLSFIYKEPVKTLEDKKRLLIKHHIALYDVIEACTITGSSDSSIKDVQPADLEELIKNTRINRIYCAGKKAYHLYLKYQSPKEPLKEIPVYCLSSTSPANAAKSIEELIKEWSMIV